MDAADAPLLLLRENGANLTGAIMNESGLIAGALVCSVVMCFTPCYRRRVEMVAGKVRFFNR